MAEQTFTVSELTDRVKNLIEDTISSVSVSGEMSNYKHHSSGHRYFTMKDESAQLRCVFFRWKAESLSFDPEDGMSVIASGKMTVYKPHGTYQLDVNRLFPSGVGALEIAFRQLKEKLFKEGLFDEEFKKPLPEFPVNVGVVTSSTGAAIQDFIRTLHNRSPWINIIIRPARVQGEGSAEDIANAIKELNEQGKVDLIVVTRGGGSLEDLWAFNEEIMARAVFESKIPIISAVGHEIDFTICDFVADVRAATPTAAAELISVDKEVLLDELKRIRQTLHDTLANRLESNRLQLEVLTTHRAFQKPLSIFEQFSIKLDHLGDRLHSSFADIYNSDMKALENLNKRLESVSPQNTLNRGYSVCTTSDGRVVRSGELVTIGDKLNVKFAKGGAKADVTNVYNNGN